MFCQCDNVLLFCEYLHEKFTQINYHMKTFTCKLQMVYVSTLQSHHVHNVHSGGVLAVVPVAMVRPLSQQLDGRLCSVHLLGWHVEVVHKHHTLLTHGWTKHTLPTPAGGGGGGGSSAQVYNYTDSSRKNV